MIISYNILQRYYIHVRVARQQKDKVRKDTTIVPEQGEHRRS